MNPHPELAGLILAAGSSSRLGQPKQLIIWRDKPLIVHAIDHAVAACGRGVTVVTGAEADAVEAAISDAGCHASIVHNAGWEQGMGASLRHGMHKITTSDARAVLIMLCDQPLVGRKDIESLVNVWCHHPDQAVATQYNNGNGVPAIFPRRMFPKLLELDGDEGARGLLANLPGASLVRVKNVALDIDTPEDLRRLLRDTKKHK